MQISISLNNSTVLIHIKFQNFELTRTRTRNSNSTRFESHIAYRVALLSWTYV